MSVSKLIKCFIGLKPALLLGSLVFLNVDEHRVMDLLSVSVLAVVIDKLAIWVYEVYDNGVINLKQNKMSFKLHKFPEHTKKMLHNYFISRTLSKL